MNSSTSLRSILIPFALLASAVCAHAQSRYTYSVSGDEVSDSHTGLVWRRCSEGQSWSGGTCIGTPATYTHEEALVQAQTQSGAAGWRLPNVKELGSIADKTRVSPAIDPTAFPATPPYYFWTSTPVAAPSSYAAWEVDFDSGNVALNLPYFTFHVRLVR